MKKHKKKMLPPIIVTAIIFIYYTLYFLLLISFLDGILKYIFGIFPLFLAGIMIYVCIERINEIKKGEEDDISKY